MLAAGMENAKTMFDGGAHDVAAEAHAIMAVAATASTSHTGLHIVGVLVTRRRDRRVRVRWRAEHIVDGRVVVDEEFPDSLSCCERVGDAEWETGTFHSIDHVWVHRMHRRRGIARLLVENAVHTHAIDVFAGITWMRPFLTSAGATLAYQFNTDEFWVA
jgi:GNAT superfamily N-acetyltransferase